MQDNLWKDYVEALYKTFPELEVKEEWARWEAKGANLKADIRSGGHFLNAGAASLSAIFLIWYLSSGGFFPLLLVCIMALLIGYHLIVQRKNLIYLSQFHLFLFYFLFHQHHLSFVFHELEDI